uniref:Murine retrovirus integration site 1 homolog n=1 Tax=Acanthochromis polyacanthus TaxID=80966 RepID=A0A3Q1F329_9TELE
MPTLPEEEEDSPEELDSSSSSPSTVSCHFSNRIFCFEQLHNPFGPKGNSINVPKILQNHNNCACVSTFLFMCVLCFSDNAGNVIDLVKDQLPELQLSEEDRQKNLELLEQAKKVSDQFLTRRGRRSTSSLTNSPTALSPPPTPSSSPCSSRSSSLTVAPQTGFLQFAVVILSLYNQMSLWVKCCENNKRMFWFCFHVQEHKLMRNQSIVGSKLPDLSEAAEQEKGKSSLITSEETKEKSDAMPNISDVMLRKLKLHRGLPGCAPPLTEKEVENAFVQLSLAFRNDNYTLETRLKQAERERNLTEEDTEKELEDFKGMTSPQWQNLEQREAYQRLIETVAVLHRLATRLSSRAEIVGAVRQEKRMNKATEVMMQYVENLKRTYEKDHAELMEFKKLANQNSNRHSVVMEPRSALFHNFCCGSGGVQS